MAGGANGIATRADANSVKSGSYATDLKRCITYASAISAGLGVYNASTYASNQLVKSSDLYVPITFLTFKFTIDISSDASLYNKGPITLNTTALKDVLPRFAREIEATEVEQDTSGIPLEYSNTHVEEPEESAMTLSTVDEVLQVAQEFEEQQEQILALDFIQIGVSLTKDDSTLTLLDSSTYGPVSVSNKKVTFTLYSTTYSSSADGTYKLSFSGSALLKNKDNQYPSGGIYASSSSTNQYKTITVSSAGTYTFNAYWKKGTTPDPSTPTPTTYKFRLRFALDGILVYQVLVNFNCTLYSSTGAVLGTCSVSSTAYQIPGDLPSDISQAGDQIGDSYAWYYIDLWTGTTIPAYVTVTNTYFYHNVNNQMSWLVTTYRIQNTLFIGSYPSISGMVYNTLNPRSTIYTVDYLVGGGVKPL